MWAWVDRRREEEWTAVWIDHRREEEWTSAWAKCGSGRRRCLPGVDCPEWRVETGIREEENEWLGKVVNSVPASVPFSLLEWYVSVPDCVSEDFENFWSGCPLEEDLKYAKAVCNQVLSSFLCSMFSAVNFLCEKGLNWIENLNSS
ncbi:hypothetical protein RHMOL_Rhmol01G0257900 [Rhododendron molle]|uniref:Uncharacterized protein n=1 Tax=Rhododendron molle TaxID=49168 RepID=A0ACC0Q594_RHOML|nr:hypothetical protein RHMOL_Rhmol01G0257900 [Rhododendron molle]